MAWKKLLHMAAGVCANYNGIIQPTNWYFYVSNVLSLTSSMIICSVYTDNNPLTYVSISAKLDATGHRWLAALGSYDFKLMYRSDKSNADADGLFRHPPQDVELFPDVVKVVYLAYLVERESCPLVETLLVLNAVSLADLPTPDLLDSTSLQNLDWSRVFLYKGLRIFTICSKNCCRPVCIDPASIISGSLLQVVSNRKAGN